MSLQEILDSLLTSARTGPLITATRHFEAKSAVYAPFPSSLDPPLVEALRSRGIQQLYSHQAQAFETVARARTS
jgi:DEAD/DEAH box helicase domain-containing protein